MATATDAEKIKNRYLQKNAYPDYFCGYDFDNEPFLLHRRAGFI